MRQPTAHAVGLPAGSVTDDDKRRQQTTDAIKQNNTNPLGGPVISSAEGTSRQYIPYKLDSHQ